MEDGWHLTQEQANPPPIHFGGAYTMCGPWAAFTRGYEKRRPTCPKCVDIVERHEGRAAPPAPAPPPPTVVAKVTNEELDRCLDAIDTALQEGRFEDVNAAIEKMDFQTVRLDLAVCVLMASKLAKEKLPAREAAVRLLTQRVLSSVPDRAAGILRHL
jgi:hypothetical protein